ncbi:hypothetical protein [Streptomyces sp. NBC_00316]|uniref:hypothetical protein n=1 Tax=Streptomyces sp. NBC_00316 TaxID=2975710 RepID=UPI002E2B3EF8|nr:hypothetical protein [Streptomyces sp. NBC_00316]
MLVAVPSAEDLNGLVEAEGRQADLQRPLQPCRSDADDHPLWRLSVVEHHLAAGGDGVACCLAGSGCSLSITVMSGGLGLSSSVAMWRL